MRFAVLGPVRAGNDEENNWSDISGVKARTVLAVLLLEANTVVSADRLIEALWGKKPPGSALASLHNHVMRLRRALGEQGDRRVRSAPRGFLIQVEPGELDLEVFTGLTDAGRQAAAEGRWEEASNRLAAALALWEGPAVSDVQGLDEHPRIRALAEARTQAMEWWLDAELWSGRHAEVIDELRSLTALHPLREGFHSQLMLALYRADRRAEALQVFEDLRSALDDSLGVEPSTSIQQLHRRMLNADPALLPETAVSTEGEAGATAVVGTGAGTGSAV